MNGPRTAIARGALCALTAGAALGCQDVVSAPGACPEFCPQGNIVIVDTVLANSTEPLGSYEGYRLPYEAGQMQVIGPGGPVESRALMVFFRFPSQYAGGDSTVKDSIVRVDSLRITLNVLRRTGVSGMLVAFHEIPIVTDSTATFTSVAPYFADSTLVATLAVPDTLTSGRIAVTVPPLAFAHFGGDSLQAGIGVRVASPDPAFLTIGPADTVVAAQLTRFVRVDTSDGSKLVTRSDQERVFFATFVTDTTGLPQPQGLAVGGLSGARAFMKLTVPPDLLDAALIVRATLLLPPLGPAFGAPGDTFRLRVQELGADFGPKSPLVTQSSDSSRTAAVVVGSSDTVRVDITDILRSWHANSALPHNVMLRVVPEAASIDRLELAPSTTTGDQGVIRITYGLPFKLPGR